jgi:predicted transcriptional regulator of viral defense system
MLDLLKTLKKHLSSPVFQIDEIKHLIKKSDDSLYSLIKRAKKRGELISLKKGLYHQALDSEKKINLFNLAQYLYGPSYISFESALSFHGWIPERVPFLTNSCIQRNQQFKTSLGTFTFEKIPLDNFYCGTEHICSTSENYIIAKPWKALLDLIYCRYHTAPGAHELIHSLRIEVDHLQTLNNQDVEEFLEYYQSQKIKKFFKQLTKDLKL